MWRVVTVLVTLLTASAAYAAATPMVGARPLSFCEAHPGHHKCQPSRLSDSSPTREPSTAPTQEPGSSPDNAVDLGIQFHGTWGDYDDTTRGLVLDKIKASGA